MVRALACTIFVFSVLMKWYRLKPYLLYALFWLCFDFFMIRPPDVGRIFGLRRSFCALDSDGSMENITAFAFAKMLWRDEKL
ncbi:MAG TPA: hypothetical protein DET40_02800 [Lentisphaeria bacterium]|nr:hypothetical protein [Lentisphaeria bacterium]